MWDLIKLTIKAWWYHVIKELFSTELSSYRSIYRVISWAPGSLAHPEWDVARGDGDHMEPKNHGDVFFLFPWYVLLNRDTYTVRLLYFKFVQAASSPLGFFSLICPLSSGHQRSWTSVTLTHNIWLLHLYVRITTSIFFHSSSQQPLFN